MPELADVGDDVTRLAFVVDPDRGSGDPIDERRGLKQDRVQELLADRRPDDRFDLRAHPFPELSPERSDGFEDGGVEKLVLAYWHKNVGDILETGLSRYGVVRLDGSTSARGREQAETEFRQKKRRVFLAQIIAAGEAIDLSPANELWFVETSFSPKDMDQMSKRITNVGQTRNCFVRVCYIENSLDEPMQQALMRLWKPINNVLS